MWTVLGVGSVMMGIAGTLVCCRWMPVRDKPPPKKFAGGMVEIHADAFGKRNDVPAHPMLQPRREKRIKPPPQRSQLNDKAGSGSTGRNLPALRKK